MAQAPRSPRRAPDAGPRQIMLQLALATVAVAILALLIYTAAVNLKRQGITSGFAFLAQPAGFDIIQHLIAYDESSSYGRAFFVGLLNTLLVSAGGIVLATVLGLIVGIARLALNPLVRRLATWYVEVLRNVPLLLQLFCWYFAGLRTLPAPATSLSLGGVVYLNNRGLYLPIPSPEGGAWHWSIPVLDGFDFTGGAIILPELVALFVALSTYTASFIAEIVRASILAIGRGQSEAAMALGLERHHVLFHVIVPQAFRTMIPPLSSQYLNITKNSSLAAAIAYPDLVLVFAGTVLLQTGQAVEVMAMTMGVFLGLSLLIAYGMNRFNRRVAVSFGHNP